MLGTSREYHSEHVKFYSANSVSYAMYGFWGLVLLIGCINRIVEYFLRCASTRNKGSSQNASISGKLRLWYRRHLLLPAVFNGQCQEPIGWCTLPPRLESLLLALFLLMNFVFCFPGYRLFLGNL